jgi:hypothetical protein
MHRAAPWVWLNCEKCQHYAPLAWRRASDPIAREHVQRQTTAGARCTACGACTHKFAMSALPFKADIAG